MGHFTKELIEKQIKALHNLQSKGVEHGVFADIWLAEKCLSLQIPQKPIMDSYCPAKCPNCNKTLSESLGDGYYKHWTSLNYCDCGQKLTWRD